MSPCRRRRRWSRQTPGSWWSIAGSLIGHAGRTGSIEMRAGRTDTTPAGIGRAARTLLNGRLRHRLRHRLRCRDAGAIAKLLPGKAHFFRRRGLLRLGARRRSGQSEAADRDSDRGCKADHDKTPYRPEMLQRPHPCEASSQYSPKCTHQQIRHIRVAAGYAPKCSRYERYHKRRLAGHVDLP